MNINNQNYNPQFGALHIANSGELKILKLTDRADLNFIKELPERVDIQRLMPNLTKDEYARWNEMLEYAVDNAQKKENTTYLQILDGKPCGIITFTPDNTTKLDCICTWPIRFGEKVKLAGKTLFYQMFKDFQQLKGKKIKLDAITNGPYDVVTKYETLGFKRTSNIHPTKVEMEINAAKIKETMKTLDNLIDYENIKPEKIDLRLNLDI